MSVKVLALHGALVVVAAVLIGLNLTSNTTALNGPIRIGAILILSGEGSSWGLAEKYGIEMAIDKINSEGGINGRRLAVDYQDDQSDPKLAVSSFRNLVDAKGIRIIIGTTWSHVGLPLVEMADENKVLVISPSLGVKEFNEGSEFLFNTWPHDYILSRNLADYIHAKGHRKVVVIGAEQVWVKDQTRNFMERFRELGGEIVLAIEPDTLNKNVYPEALRIKTAVDEGGVDAIVSTTDGTLVGVHVAKRVRELGVSLPMYSITIDANVIEIAQGSYEGMEFLTFLTPSEEFKAAYEEKTGIPIDIGADSSYDAVMLIAKAIRETNSTDTNILQEYLNGVKEYKGVSGNLVADGKGGFIKPYSIKRVVNGTAADISG